MTARNAANAGSKQGSRVTGRQNLSQSFGSILLEKGFYKEVRGMEKDCELCAGLNEATTKIYVDGYWLPCCMECYEEELEDYE